MKLLNKKTGEIVEAESCNSYSGTIGLFFEKGRETDRAYETLAELNEEWEDYKPAEPLIKDEKIRKAVRAWADTYEIVAVRHIVLRYDKTKHSVFETGYGNDYSAITLETELDFVDGDTYSIAELCGEEEE